MPQLMTQSKRSTVHHTASNRTPTHNSNSAQPAFSYSIPRPKVSVATQQVASMLAPSSSLSTVDIYEDKTPAKILTSFSPSKTGTTLADRAVANEWLQVTRGRVPRAQITAPALNAHDREIFSSLFKEPFNLEIGRSADDKPPDTRDNATSVTL